MCDFNKRLQQLVQRVCRYAPRSPSRQRTLTQLIRLISQSGYLWNDYRAGYEDALQQTWLFVCQNLCESVTAKSPYDPDRSSLLTWINTYLKGQVKQHALRVDRDQRRNVSIEANALESLQENWLYHAPSPEALSLTIALKEWLSTDPTGELCRTHIQNHPEVNCQFLIQQRLCEASTWETIAQMTHLNISTLSAFYERQCRPRLIQFAHSQGYSESF